MTSVKVLAESCNLTSIPSHYAIPTSTSGDQAIPTSTSGDQAVHSDHDDSIPIIDFSLLSSTDPDRRSKAVSDIAKALQDWGVFMLINHGVPDSLMKTTVDTLIKFFDLTEEEKREFQGKRVLDPIQCGTSCNPLAGKDKVLFWRDFLKVWASPELHCPAKPEGLRYHCGCIYIYKICNAPQL